MKKIILFLFLLAAGNLLGQELPEVISPTPEAASLGKYGNTPISKYTGVPNISIPLYTIKEGDITIPITLSYHAGGFRVQEEATWVGLGWSLNAGGSISRDPRGDADKLGSSHDDFSSWGENNILPDNFISPNNNADYALYGIERVFRTDIHRTLSEMDNYFSQEGAEYRHDYQADHFHYTYPGVAGEFYNKDNNNFTDLSQNLKKIEYNTEDEFVITDENGFTYLYGSVNSINNAKEYSSTDTYVNGSLNPGMNISMNFHLTNVTSKLGNQVNFFYRNNESRDPSISSVSVKHSEVYIPRQVESFSEGDPNDIFVLSRTKTYTSILSKIEFTHGFVKFIVNDESDLRKDLAGAGSKKLESIEVYKYVDPQGNFELVKKFKFNYSYFISPLAPVYKYNPTLYDFNAEANSKRLKLESIEEYGSNNNNPKVYEFQYNNIPLPHKTSYSVDKYGYYNGAANTTFIPELIMGQGANIQYSGAEVTPNPEYVEACLIEKIIYPTKGSTNFIYEPNEYKVNYAIKDTVHYHSSTFDNYGGNPNNNTNNSNGTFTLNEDQSVHVKVDLVAINTSNSPASLYVELYDNNNNFYKKWDVNVPPGTGSCSTNECHFETSLYLNAGTYNIVTQNNTSILNQSQSAVNVATATIKYSFKDNNDKSEYGPGVRIKEIIDKDQDERIVTHKKFEYLEENPTINPESSGVLLYNPSFLYYTYKIEILEHLGVTSVDYKLIFYRTNRPRKSFSTSANGKMLGYNTVTEFNVDLQNDKQNGRIVYEYHNNIDDVNLEGADNHGQQNFPCLSSPLNGLLKNKKIFKFKNGEYKIVNNESFNYKILSSDVKWYGATYPFTATYSATSGDFFSTISALGAHIFPICLYPEISTFVGLDSSAEKIYDFDDENKFVTITKNYEYENTQLIKETTASSMGKIETTKYFYPLTSNRPTGIVPQKMLDKNILSPLIVSTYEVENNLISTAVNDYKVWYGNTTGSLTDDIILPEKIKLLKNSEVSGKEIIFHDYDQSGNPLVVSKKDGANISYIWGYEDQYPIAKIENATYTEIATALNTTVIALKAFNETNLSQINSLRTSLAKAMITTYTYKPLVGILTVTDPKGYTIKYEYDEFNRLKFVKDHEGNLISENRYRYKD